MDLCDPFPSCISLPCLPSLGTSALPVTLPLNLPWKYEREMSKLFPDNLNVFYSLFLEIREPWAV